MPQYLLICVTTIVLKSSRSGLQHLKDWAAVKLTSQLYPLVSSLDDAVNGLNLTLYWLAHTSIKSEAFRAEFF